MAGLYFHIPFCTSKCTYCDFYSMPPRGRTEILVDALLSEYHHRCNEISEPFKTLYIGGGTPSLLPDNLLEKLVSGLNLHDIEEFTIEVNPDDVTSERVAAWKAIGINRISMGVQSFDDRQLKIIGRRHNATQAKVAIDTILNGGIINLTCDLIYGLPEQTIESWAYSLQQLLDYHLPHLSAYCLSYEPGTRLYAALTAGHITPTDDMVLQQMYYHLCSATLNAGYEHYEISNFAIPGYHSRHNSSYWDSTPYLGLGPGAHSFDGKTRRFNRPDLLNYLRCPDRFTTIDNENDNERYNDMLITALRTSDGLNISGLTSKQRENLLSAANHWLNSGDLRLDGNRLTISEASWFISDSILRELIVV